MIAILGGALGVALAALASRAPGRVPRQRAARARHDARREGLMFTFAITIVTGLVFGLAPLLHLREQGVVERAQRRRQRSTSGGARPDAQRRW